MSDTLDRLKQDVERIAELTTWTHFRDRNKLQRVLDLWPLALDVIEAAPVVLDELGVGYPIDDPEMEKEVRRNHGDALCDLALRHAAFLSAAERETE